ncbi:Flap-structured DNA-binding and RNA-binding protein [Ascosphaera acerosa]|nr:Flap-structured DNA-binding and RNA-binding protein [Ascosphaera acerosa]
MASRATIGVSSEYDIASSGVASATTITTASSTGAVLSYLGDAAGPRPRPRALPHSQPQSHPRPQFITAPAAAPAPSGLRAPPSATIPAPAGAPQLRASADMSSSSLTAPLSARNPRPRSEIFFSGPQHLHPLANPIDEALDNAAQQWLADIEQYETTLEEMAAATLDRGFKGELGSIEQWFRMLSEAERTAALYSLLQQTTQVQIRFFIQVLQQMSKSNPVAGMLSPSPHGGDGESQASILASSSEELLTRGPIIPLADAMSSRLNDAMSKLNVESPHASPHSRSLLCPGGPTTTMPGSAGAQGGTAAAGAAATNASSISSTSTTATAGATAVTPSTATTSTTKRNSGLDSSTINAMFPDAAAVIAKKRAEFSRQATNSPPPNRASSAFERPQQVSTPTICTPAGSQEAQQPPGSPWRRTPDAQSQSLTQSQSQSQSQSQAQPQPQSRQGQGQTHGQASQPPIARPKSSSSQQQQSPLSAGLPPTLATTASAAADNVRSTTVTFPDLASQTAALLTPLPPGASWASLTSTPVFPTFGSSGTLGAQLQSPNPALGMVSMGAGNGAGAGLGSAGLAATATAGSSQADMVANAAAMKLAALSTVNGRFALDDARKYRRARSNDTNATQRHAHHNNFLQQQQQRQQQQATTMTMTTSSSLAPPPLTPTIATPDDTSMSSNDIMGGLASPSLVMVDDAGQVLNANQLAVLQAQQQQQQQQASTNLTASLNSGLGLRPLSRPRSPGLNPIQLQLQLQQPGSMAGALAAATATTMPGGLAPGRTTGTSNYLSATAAYGMNSWLGGGNASLLGDGLGLGLGAGGLGSGASTGYLSDHSEIHRGRSPRGRRGTSKPPEDPTDPALLRDIPGWLRSLRLHKYTDNLKDMQWTDLVELDDAGLEARGVNALGARNKMLKVFEQVREAKKEGKLDAIL